MTQEQLNKLDICHHAFSLDDECIEEFIDARELLGANRFDLYAILLYIDSRVKGLSDNKYHEFVYHCRTGALAGYRYHETGKSHKNSYEDYRNDLDKLIDSFLSGNFDENRRFIPIDKNGILIDGAHRVACLAYFNKKVNVLRFPGKEESRVTYKSQIRSNLPVEVADAMALEATKWHDDLYMYLLWPKSYENKEALKESLDIISSRFEVIYEKMQVLSFRSIKNLMIQIYGHMDWIGDVNNGFRGVDGKVEAVWSPEGMCHFVLIRSKSLQYVLDVKNEIRKIYNIGLASLHSTDNLRETRIAANALFNPNSLHFLNNGEPELFKNSISHFFEFKNILVKNKLNLEKYLIDSGMALAIYGARESYDLDYICESTDELKHINSFDCSKCNIERHKEEQLSYYQLNVRDLLYNPEHYFVFNEIKFVSLSSLKVFKKNRFNKDKEYKDAADIKLIDACLDSSQYKRLGKLYRGLKWQIQCEIRGKTGRTKTKIVLFLKRVGLYDTLKYIVKGNK